MNDRYSRQVLFSAIGAEGQARIRAGHVAVVGCGALGSVNSEMLTRAGVGRITIIDRDWVELSNLQRQSLFRESHVDEGLPKAVAAVETLRGFNSEVDIVGHVEDLTFENIDQLCGAADLIIDGSDNFEVRFLVNDFAVKHSIPWIYGAALGSYGLAMSIVPGSSPCLQCLFEDPPPAGSGQTCETAGVLAPIIHVVCAFQVTQALRLLVGQPVSSGLLQVDVWSNTWRTVTELSPRQNCSCCRDRQFRFLYGDSRSVTTRLCGRNAIQVNPRQPDPVDLVALSRKIPESYRPKANPFLLRFWASDHEFVVFADGRAIIKGTEDPAKARALYSRYVGN